MFRVCRSHRASRVCPHIAQGQKFYAHRIALLASSDTFRAMFDGHYKEKDASEIPIPNIRFEVFRRMMTCAYTGAPPPPPPPKALVRTCTH